MTKSDEDQQCFGAVFRTTSVEVEPNSGRNITVQAVSQFYGIPLRTCSIAEATCKTRGEIVGRNMFLFATALMECAPSVTAIAVGVHAGAEHPDCSLGIVAATDSLIRIST